MAKKRKLKSKKKVNPSKKSSSAGQGKVNKEFVAVIVAVVGIILLLLLIFFPGRPLVGEAISFEAATEGYAGIFAPESSSTNVGDTITVPVRANIGATQSVSISFSLTYDETVLTPICDSIFDVLNAQFTIPGNDGFDYDLTTRSEASCENGIITFEYAGLCAPPVDECLNAITADSLLAEIQFTADQVTEETVLEFETFNLFDLAANPLEIDFSDASFAVTEAQEVETEAVTETTTSISSRGGGGVGRCIARWNCGSWSFCGESLEQSRTCVDQKCGKIDKIETRACFPCQESWTCTAWSTCKNGQQTRSCVDEHVCGTYDARPALTKTCRQTALTTPPPARVAEELPAPSLAQPAKVPLFKNWRTYVGIVLALIVIGAIVTLVVYEVRKRRVD